MTGAFSQPAVKRHAVYILLLSQIQDKAVPGILSHPFRFGHSKIPQMNQGNAQIKSRQDSHNGKILLFHMKRRIFLRLRAAGSAFPGLFRGKPQGSVLQGFLWRPDIKRL